MSIRTPLPVALELYTVRDEVARDMSGVLRQVAAMGYDGVEFAGYGGLAAEDMRDLLVEIGLEIAGTHVSHERLDADFEGEIKYCRTIGCQEIVLPSLPEHVRAAENSQEAIRLLNNLGARCRDAGLGFGYHNHDFEFEESDGGMLWEQMAEGTDPESVFFELDVYWVAYAGCDFRQLLQRYPGRIPFVHFKDMAPDRSDTEVGAGSLGLDTLYRDGLELGIRWAIVELDKPTIPSLRSAEMSLRALHAARDAGYHA